ncbi:MAG: M48 family metalloprotease [Candidatus Dependentiae bacterium]|nr:M48 family metalloprotease [Candidatus Dependentiae bacterium]
MILRNNITRGLLIACLLTSTATLPMHKAFNEIKKVAAYAPALISSGIIAANILDAHTVYKNTVTIQDNLSDAPDWIKQYVHKECSSQGIDPQTLKVKFDDNLETAAAAGLDTIILRPYAKDQYNQKLDLNKRLIESNLAYKGLIHHELAHIKHQDVFNRMIALQALPSIGALGLTAALAHPFMKPIPSMARIIGASIIMLSLQYNKFTLMNPYCRFQEQRADDSIRSDINILKAYVEGTKPLYDHMISDETYIQKKKSLPYCILPESISNRLLQIAFDPTHPHQLDSVAKLEDRIAKLKAHEEQSKK